MKPSDLQETSLAVLGDRGKFPLSQYIVFLLWRETYHVLAMRYPVNGIYLARSGKMCFSDIQIYGNLSLVFIC